MPRIARTLRHAILLIALLSAAGCATPETAKTPQSAPVTVYEGATVITGDGSPSIENAAFTVENDRFVQVGRVGQIQVPAGARRVALHGKTVMPAIIDTHKHLTNAAVATRETAID